MIRLFFFAIAIVACNNGPTDHAANKGPGSLPDSMEQKVTETPSVNNGADSTTSGAKEYSNIRFKEVITEKLGANKYRVTGKGQIFEARFGWAVEDGHHVLDQGYEDTDAVAPRWGNFDFTVQVTKASSSSTLHLVLFETSAKDGKRVYELPIPLK